VAANRRSVRVRARIEISRFRIFQLIHPGRGVHLGVLVSRSQTAFFLCVGAGKTHTKEKKRSGYARLPKSVVSSDVYGYVHIMNVQQCICIINLCFSYIAISLFLLFVPPTLSCIEIISGRPALFVF